MRIGDIPTSCFTIRPSIQRLYEFADVFTERKIGDNVQFWSVVAGVEGGFWFVVIKIRRDRKRS